MTSQLMDVKLEISQDEKNGVVHTEDADEDVNLEIQQDLRAFGDRGRCYWCVIKKTQQD